jgi:hypothetical protein
VWVIFRNAMAYMKGAPNIMSILGDSSLDGEFRTVLILASTVLPMLIWPIELSMWIIVSTARH